MRLLLDTQALLWALFEPEMLSEDVDRALLDPGNEVLVSLASAWEIAARQTCGRLELDGDLAEILEESGFKTLPVSLEHCRAYAALPDHSGHRDPFGRMLLAQALTESCRLVSADGGLDRYGVSRYW